ncbi:MAG: hypothetical protein J7K75_04050 [Desulfuromonas sp.]|nr:hypothetical protein [Desulfuromonas sp.]
MKIKQWLSLFAVISSMLFAACGSNSGSGGDQTASLADDLGNDNSGIALVGTAVCIGCHEDFSWSAQEVADYLAGKHVVHSSHISQADAADDCLDCHDPIGDSAELETLIDPANVPAEGLAAVGCENCHGAGGDHYGVGPMPVATPDYTVCATCHDELPDSHLSYHPEANFIATKFVASRHFTTTVITEAICSKCHSDEGAKQYKDVTSREQLLAIVLPVATDDPIQCRTCHNPHHAGGLLLESVESGGELVESAEYATCVSCHMAADATMADDGMGGTDWDNTELIYHQDVYYRIITDSHSDDPATTDIIEGYVINPKSDRACRDCHDVHSVVEIRADDDSASFSNTIHDQWSMSGHGGFIGTIKLAKAEEYDDMALNLTTEQSVAIKEAGVTSADADAWVHYDWDAQDRQSCQDCHTATGAKNYLNDPAGYDAADNDFSHLVGWSIADGVVTSSGQNELLYCWGCHSDNSGGLRNPGAISQPYTVDGAAVILPDQGNSNVCINCHGARGNMDSYQIGASDAPLSGDPSADMSAYLPGFVGNTENVTAPHYAAAAATLFQARTRIGYQYGGLSYADLPYFAHDVTALNSDAPESGSGPCVACHMETATGHSFEVVGKTGDVITGLNSTVCINCHDGGHGPALVVEDTTIDGTLHTAAAAAALLQEEAEGFHDALALLQAELLVKELTFTGSYPYFAGARWIDEGTFGAAHNFNYLHHEPGAYAHNRIYAKRLIFDSINWLQDGVLDGTIAINAAMYPEATAWLGADAGVASRP